MDNHEKIELMKIAATIAAPIVAKLKIEDIDKLINDVYQILLRIYQEPHK